MTRLGWIAVALAACADPMGSTTDVSYRRDLQPIWDRWCNQCHVVTSPRLISEFGGHELEGESWYRCRDGVASAPFVVAGDPDASFLMYKLSGANPMAYWTGEGCDRMMPADFNSGGRPLEELDPTAVSLVRRWIEEGARLD